MKKRAGPPCSHLASPTEVELFRQEHDVVAIGFFTDKEAAGYQMFEKAARVSDDVPFGNVMDVGVRDGLGAAAESVMLYKKFDQAETKFTGELNDSDLTAFVKLNSLPKIIRFSEKTAAQIFGSETKTHLVVFFDSETHASLHSELLGPATEWQGKFLFIHIPKSEEQIMDYFGVRMDELPAARIVDLRTEIMRKYAFTQPQITGEAIQQFLENYSKGKVPQILRSEAVPPPQAQGEVRKIVQESFASEVEENELDVLVEFYAPWCEHCKELKPKYEQLASNLKDVSTLVIGKVDAEQNELPQVKIEGFPTIKLWPAGQKENPVNFEGERTLDGLSSFLKEHVTHKWFADKHDGSKHNEL
eukprot:TRINITY_DN475_c0_g1_i13.p1 TRINITY_DN475_c0_g1~~TRINITY_DN475_c0_g1_i13.p1  ORF type:complete len:360 (+),score=56.16 TRINITY_DN475_c0_g1_i13:654-1733(+)